MVQSTPLPRCFAVVALATGLLAALTAFLLPDVEAGLAPLHAGSATPPAFPELLVRGCATLALLTATWLWAITCLATVRVARGRDVAGTRAVPAIVRRLVLLGCGVALAGATAVPADAEPGASGGIAGLPLPDRALGAAHAVPFAHEAARRPGTDRSAAADPGVRVVVVRPGDTLWELAVRHLRPGAGPDEITRCWQRIHALNRDVIGADPDLIQPGQRLRLPRR